MSARSMMRHRVTIRRPAITKDEAGGKKTDFVATEHNSVPAFVQPASSNTAYDYARRELRVTHTVFVVKDLGIRAGWQVLFGTRTLIVQGFRDASAGTNTCWAIDCEEHVNGN